MELLVVPLVDIMVGGVHLLTLVCIQVVVVVVRRIYVYRHTQWETG